MTTKTPTTEVTTPVPADAPNPTPAMQEPAEGGRYLRDPETGVLTKLPD